MATKIEIALAKVYKAADIYNGWEPYVSINLLQSSRGLEYREYYVRVSWFDTKINMHNTQVQAKNKILEESVNIVLTKLKEVDLEREEV